METNAIDASLAHLGAFGAYHLYVYLVACLPELIGGIVMLSIVFVSATPLHRCLVPDCDTDANTNYFQQYLAFTIPNLFNSNNTYDSCRRYSPIDWQNQTAFKCGQNWFDSNRTETCHSFVYDSSEFRSTVATEWHVVCDQSWRLPLSRSVFMSGVLFGALCFGTFADRFGRRKVFFIAPYLALAACFWSAYTTSFAVYTIASAVMVGCVAGMYLTAYIIAFEFIVSPKWRVWCANIQQMLFSLGEVLLCVLAYYVRDWRDLQFALGVIISISLAFQWLLPESVRWQVNNGQSHEAMKTLIKAAKWNKVILPEHLSLTSSLNTYIKVKHYAPFDLLRHPITRRWTLNLFAIWFVNSLVFYGLSLQASNLGADTYVTFAWLSAVEIPAILIATFLIQIYGRKWILFLLLVIGGVACISPAFLPHRYSWLTTAFAIFGKSNISASFALTYIYSGEIFPTVLRSTGLGMCSMFARIGGILAPHLIELSIFGANVPLVFSGLLSVIAGVLALNLPETHNKQLLETLDDIECASLLYSKRSDDYMSLLSRDNQSQDEENIKIKEERVKLLLDMEN